jgi:hypothetical protein
MAQTEVLTDLVFQQIRPACPFHKKQALTKEWQTLNTAS